MNLIWQAYLRSHGAVIQDGRVVDYGENAAELESARSATVLSDLSHLGLIHFLGEDAQSFLQGQLSCDVKQVNASAALYGGYCNPKGRLLASFLIWSQSSSNGGGYVMQLPAELGPGIQKRLAMYVLRAKVKLADTSDTQIRLGVAGDDAEALVRKNLGEIPASRLGVIQGESASIIRLAQNRFELVVVPEKAPAIWEGLSKDAVPVGASCWDWLEIKAGIPVITPATQEQFVPQMTNLEAIGGVSFQKGCYPGQEIVARSQYLGKIKRRMYLANIRPGISENPVEAGDELFGADMGEQSVGMVVNASPSPDGGFDVLAVIQTSSVEATRVRWKSLAGPSLEIAPLPYSLG
jgi:folate-binding protein YgfZ